MEHNTPQKIKLLKIWEILNQKTDKEHQITTQQLIDELEKYGVFSERRSIYRDIETLRLHGYEISKGRCGHNCTYFVHNRQFNIPEIKIIMDAVQSAVFIPEEKTGELLDKLANLSGSFRGELLKRNTVHFQTVKHNNNDIYLNVEVIETALEKKKKITFNYFHINEYKSKIYTHDKKLYKEEPIGIMFEGGNYYLLCYRTQEEYTNNVKIFRIDRMDNLTVVEENLSQKAMKVLNEINTTYRSQIFRMYGGVKQKVVLQFTPDLIEVIYDKFGYDTQIRHSKDGCTAAVEVQISPTFWGWMLQFPKKMKIHSPKQLKEEYYEWVKSAM